MSEAPPRPPATPLRGRTARVLRAAAGLAAAFADGLETAGWRPAAAAAWRRSLKPALARRAPKPAPAAIAATAAPLREGVLFAGYTEGSLGLGQSLRLDLKAVEPTGLDFAVHPVSAGIETRRAGLFMAERTDRSGRYPVTLVEVASDQLPTVLAEIGPERLAGSRLILRTYWELPRAPEAWAAHLAGVSEIWAPTRFVADAFAGVFEGPIRHVPPAMEVPSLDAEGEPFALPPGRFHFLFSFDYFSYPARKNPLGVIRAFRDAFPPTRSDVGLVVKSNGDAGHHPDVRAAMEAHAREDGRIRLVHGEISRPAMLGLLRAADAYVSLHRSEGFGQGMAEAMLFAKPVIGTDYSGSTDFLNHETGFPVSYRLRPVAPGEYAWSAGQSWAEPDHKSAVEAMRFVADHPDEARRRGETARRSLAARYGLDPVGLVLARRLGALLAEGR